MQVLTLCLKFNLHHVHVPTFHRTEEINLSCASTLIGAALFIGCRLKILGFTSSADLLMALLLMLLTRRTLFAQLERLMQQMEESKLKAID